MKMFAIAAAGLAMMTGVAPGLVAPAAAQHTVVREHTVIHGPAPRAWHTRKVCTNRWNHGHKVRTCRTVRYR